MDEGELKGGYYPDFMTGLSEIFSTNAGKGLKMTNTRLEERRCDSNKTGTASLQFAVPGALKIYRVSL